MNKSVDNNLQKLFYYFLVVRSCACVNDISIKLKGTLRRFTFTIKYEYPLNKNCYLYKDSFWLFCVCVFFFRATIYSIRDNLNKKITIFFSGKLI